MRTKAASVLLIMGCLVDISAPFYPYRSRRRYQGDGGANEDHTWRVKAEAIGKCKNDNSPYLIANEWIAAHVGQILRLPIPPCSLVRKRSRDTVMFASQSFEGDTTPDDMKPNALYSRFPLLCAGIVVFDILIANRDRGKWNIKVDNPDSPALVRVIDHERSLFYCYPGEGEQQLLSRVDRFGITPSTVSDGGRHCLIELIDDAEMLFHWVQRVWSIPPWFFSDVCHEVKSLSIKDAECKAVVKFLTERARNIGNLIKANRNRFPMVKSWQNLWT